MVHTFIQAVVIYNFFLSPGLCVQTGSVCMWNMHTGWQSTCWAVSRLQPPLPRGAHSIRALHQEVHASYAHACGSCMSVVSQALAEWLFIESWISAYKARECVPLTLCYSERLSFYPRYIVSRHFRCDCGNGRFSNFKCSLYPVSPLLLWISACWARVSCVSRDTCWALSEEYYLTCV